jgi:hypothetical protein
MFLGGFNISHFGSIEDPAVSARLVHSPHPHPPFVGLPLHAAFIVGKSYQGKGHGVVAETKRAHRNWTDGNGRDTDERATFTRRKTHDGL